MKQETTVTVPAPVVLNSNDRLHWAPADERTGQMRTLGKLAGRKMFPVPGSVRVRVDVDVFKGRAGRYDPTNLYPSAKAILDGLTDAGVFVDDDYKHVDGPHMHHGGVREELRGRRPRGGRVAFVFRLESIGGSL